MDFFSFLSNIYRKIARFLSLAPMADRSLVKQTMPERLSVSAIGAVMEIVICINVTDTIVLKVWFG